MRYSDLQLLERHKDRLTPTMRDLVDRVRASVSTPPLDWNKVRDRYQRGFEVFEESQAKALNMFWLGNRMGLGGDRGFRPDDLGDIDHDALTKAYFGKEIQPLQAANHISEFETPTIDKATGRERPPIADALAWYESRMTPAARTVAVNIAVTGGVDWGALRRLSAEDRALAYDYARIRSGLEEFTFTDALRQIGGNAIDTIQTMRAGMARMARQPRVRSEAVQARRKFEKEILAVQKQGVIEGAAVGAADMLPYMGLTIATGGISAFMHFTEDFRQRLIAKGVDPDTSAAAAAVTGFPYMMVENLQAWTLLHGTPVGMKLGKSGLASAWSELMENRIAEFLARRTLGALTEVGEEGVQQAIEEIAFGTLTDTLGGVEVASQSVEAMKQAAGPMGVLQILAGGIEVGGRALKAGQLSAWDTRQKAIDRTKEPEPDIEVLPEDVLSRVDETETQEDARELLATMGYDPDILPQVEEQVAVLAEERALAEEDVLSDIQQLELAQEQELQALAEPAATAEAQVEPEPVASEIEALQFSLQTEVDKHPELEGVRVELVDIIPPPDWAAEGTQAQGQVDGNIIRIALGTEKPANVVREEVFHRMEELGVLTPQDLDILKRHDREWRDTYNIDVLYEQAAEDVKSEEGRAHAFAAFPEQQRRIIDKIRAFFEALRNWIAGNGWRTADDVFRDIDARRRTSVEADEVPAGDSVRFSMEQQDDLESKGAVFHRGADPRTSANVVLWSDDPEAIESYGAKQYALLPTNIIAVPDWVQGYAEQYYREELGDSYEDYLAPEVNPEDIVNSAGVWDNEEFVSQFWQDNETKLLDLADQGIFGFKTEDGAVTFAGPAIPVVQLSDAADEAQSEDDDALSTRYSLAGAPSQAERDARTVLAARLYQGQETTVADAEAMLPAAKKDQAERVLADAKQIAEVASTQLAGVKNDPRIRSEIKRAEINLHYGRLVEQVRKREFKRGVRTEAARRRINERAKAAAIRELDARKGMSVSEVNADGFDAVRELQAVLPAPEAERAPKKKVAEDASDAESEQDSDETYDVEGEAADELPPPPPIDPKNWSEFAQQVSDRVMQALVAEVGSVEAASPLFIREYQHTLMNVIDAAARDMLPSASREAIRVHMAKLRNYRRLSALETAARKLADRVNRESIRQKKNVLLGKIDRLLKAKMLRGRDASTRELIHRKVHPGARRWLKLVKGVVHSKTALEDVRSVKLYLDHPDLALEGTTEDAYRKALITKYSGLEDKVYAAMDTQDLALVLHQALYEFGDLRSRSVADVAEALDKLVETVKLGKQAIEKAIDERQKYVEPIREAFIDTFDTDRKVPGRRGGAAKIATMPLLNKMRSLTRFGESNAVAHARREAVKLNDRIQAAVTQEQTEVRTTLEQFYDNLKQIYGRDPARVVRDLQRPRDEYRKYSNQNVSLSKANLLQLYAGLTQPDYAENARKYGRLGKYLADLKSELSPEDIRLLDWFWQYDQDAVGPISKVSEEITGLPVISTGTRHWFAAIDRPKRGLSERHQVSTIIPPALSDRIRHKHDFDEMADIIGVFRERLEQFAHYKAFAKLSSDLRGIFGPAKFQEAMRNIHGDSYAREFMSHITDVVNGRIFSTGVTPLVDDVLNQSRGMVAVSALAGSFRVLAGQPTSIPAFGLEMSQRQSGTLSGAIARLFTPEGMQAIRTIWNSDERKNRFRSGPNEVFNNAVNSKNPLLLSAAIRKAMLTTSVGDIVPTLIVGPGVYLNRYEQNLRTMTEAEASKDALNYLFAMVNLTQQSPNIVNQAAWLRAGTPYRSLAQFTTTQSQYLGYETLAAEDLAARIEGATPRAINALILNHIVLPGAYNIAKLAYDSVILGDEPEESDLWNLGVSMLIGQWSGLIFVGSIAESLARILFTGRYPWQISGIPSLEHATRIASHVGLLLRHGVSGDWDDMSEEFDRLLQSLVSPYRDAKRALENRQ